CSLMLLTFGGAVFGFLEYNPPLSLVWNLAFYSLFVLGQVCFLTFFYLFPSGHLVPRWTRWCTLLYTAYWLVWIFILGGLASGPPGSLFLLFLLTAVIAQVYRYRSISTRSERQQTKWVVFGFAAGMLLFLSTRLITFHSPVIDYLVGASSVYLSFMLIPIFIGIAVFRAHLFDIDIIIKRTLVYGTLTACVVGIYVLVVGYLGALFHTGSSLLISLLATGLVAVLFQPLRELLQRGVNRLFYGQRDEPYQVISRLGQRLEAALAPDAVLPVIVETVAQALKLPYAAIALKQDGEFTLAASYVAKHGESRAWDASLHRPENVLHLPLLYQSEQVGELLLAPRARGEAFTSADRRLLDDLARQVGIATHAVRLTADLQLSRERLVRAREEERRRLRRDLHDGLGPTLATITVKAEAAHDAIAAEPTQAIILLEELIGQAQTAIGDIRRLVYNLRPPALDDLGFVVAIRTQALHYERPGLHISIDVPEPLPELPAAVEVAAYRIVQEALTNVVRHANAHSCLIRLAFDGALHLSVTDDGCGISVDRQAGVGLRSMQERAEELGGRCRVEALPSKGTAIRVTLPCSSNEKHVGQEPV
ncbi:MAG TPA: histidine kinase, partial [Ktedonobacteraceae bacterium]